MGNNFGSMDFASVETIPVVNKGVVFTDDSSHIFREDEKVAPITLTNGVRYMPWGADDQLPYRIMEKIERDETLSTCQVFNAEVCYGNGLRYNTDNASSTIKNSVEDFLIWNDIPSYFLGVCQDFKYFGFCVSVIILDKVGKNIVGIHRKEACYCRFQVMEHGVIKNVLYGNFRDGCPSVQDIEFIPLLSFCTPWADLQDRMERKSHLRKFAVVSRVPTPDCTYYPIPYYASLFKGKWYNIKQLIGIAKEAKLKNSAPIKYHIEISLKYWKNIFEREKITDQVQKQKRINVEKNKIIDFLSGVENSGKVFFSTYYVSPDGKEQHDVVISKIDDSKEGGDWESDIQEAVNMFCFTMRVHSNLVGSVPGKSQSNNSGSDKRELYTIAQALQKPYHDLLFAVHRIIIRFNKWNGVVPECPFIQLTTLDENKDAKLVSADKVPA